MSCVCTGGYIYISGEKILCPECGGESVKTIGMSDADADIFTRVAKAFSEEKLDKNQLYKPKGILGSNIYYDGGALRELSFDKTYTQESIDLTQEFLDTMIRKSNAGEYMEGNYFIHVPSAKGPVLYTWALQVVMQLKANKQDIEPVINADELYQLYRFYTGESSLPKVLTKQKKQLMVQKDLDDSESADETLEDKERYEVYEKPDENIVVSLFNQGLHWNKYVFSRLAIVRIPYVVSSKVLMVLLEFIQRRSARGYSTYIISDIHDYNLVKERTGFQYFIPCSNLVNNFVKLKFVCYEPIKPYKMGERNYDRKTLYGK